MIAVGLEIEISACASVSESFHHAWGNWQFLDGCTPTRVSQAIVPGAILATGGAELTRVCALHYHEVMGTLRTRDVAHRKRS
jgi:hypothetical protein